VHNHPAAKLDAKRRKLIRDALKAYPEADLCQAISGYKNSPHHMGQNDRSTVYDAIELLLRDAKHIDAGLRFYRDPPRTDLSKLTRANVDRTANWRPPELRDAG
jgi:cellulase/cellobiase CelA1